MLDRALIEAFFFTEYVVVGNPLPISELNPAGARNVPNAPNAPAAHTLRPLTIPVGVCQRQWTVGDPFSRHSKARPEQVLAFCRWANVRLAIDTRAHRW